MIKLKSVFILIFVFTTSIYSQFNDNKFGLALSYNYSTSARLYPYPNSVNQIFRDENIQLDGFYSISTEFMYRASKSIILSVGTEYINHTKNLRVFTVAGTEGVSRLTAKEGFELIPFDASIYYYLPFSTETVKFFMGGGFSIYYGSHIREFSEVRAENVSRDFSYGIQASLGMDYMLLDYLSARFKMKFRDPDFKLISRYNKETVTIDGKEYQIPLFNFDSRFNLDGVAFSLGLVFHF